MYTFLRVPDMAQGVAIIFQHQVWLFAEQGLLSVPAGLGFGQLRAHHNLIPDGRASRPGRAWVGMAMRKGVI